MVHKVSHRPDRRFFMSLTFALNWTGDRVLKSGVFPCLDNIEYKSRMGFWGLGQSGCGFAWVLTDGKKARSLVSVEFTNKRALSITTR